MVLALSVVEVIRDVKGTEDKVELKMASNRNDAREVV